MKKWVIAVLAAASFSVQAAGDAAAGQAASVTCAGCHGPDGNSMAPMWPKLAGQGADYLVKQLQDFKAGKRTDPMMSGMAMPLTDEAMLNLAAYFSSQKISAGVPGSAEQVALGKQIYTAGLADKGVAACTACHGVDGKGNAAAKFPALAAQHSAYVVKQLQAFRDGARNNDMNEMMRGVAKGLTDAQMEAVAAYISSLSS